MLVESFRYRRWPLSLIKLTAQIAKDCETLWDKVYEIILLFFYSCFQVNLRINLS